MNNKTLLLLLVCAALIMPGCSKDYSTSQRVTQSEQESAQKGAVQISGLGFFDAADECNSPAQEADYAITMTGDIEGCLYTYVDEFKCSPSGTYYEVGREYFVGTYKGELGTFWTNYKFEAKYEGCAENGSYVGAEIKGRCQHPIVKDSGTGDFEGATGRIDFKDDIEAANYPYRGHFRF